jgi:hypothetical protein
MSQTTIQLSDPLMAARHAPDLADPRSTNPEVEQTWRQKMIREAAYFRSLHRQPCEGKQLEDWLTAEREIES